MQHRLDEMRGLDLAAQLSRSKVRAICIQARIKRHHFELRMIMHHAVP
jgi:hypothetical protein